MVTVRPLDTASQVEPSIAVVVIVPVASAELCIVAAAEVESTPWGEDASAETWGAKSKKVRPRRSSNGAKARRFCRWSSRSGSGTAADSACALGSHGNAFSGSVAAALADSANDWVGICVTALPAALVSTACTCSTNRPNSGRMAARSASKVPFASPSPDANRKLILWLRFGSKLEKSENLFGR